MKKNSFFSFKVYEIQNLNFFFIYFLELLIMRILKPVHYNLQSFQRSNQDTSLVHKPAVFEGEWVQPGDLLADCSSSIAGELSLGQNILIAYMPWEGYNYEDAILISERLVYDDLYTSIHIEKYEVETSITKYGYEEITKKIPDLSKEALQHLDEHGVIKKGSFVFEGDILVGKVTPIEKKFKSPYQKLLYNILEKELSPVRDSSLRAPKGLRAKVLERKIFEAPPLSFTSEALTPLASQAKRGKLNEFGSEIAPEAIHLGSERVFGVHATKENLVAKRAKKKTKIKSEKNHKWVHLYLAEKRRAQVGDKMAGRHGNKGIISKILAIQDMPYLPDGSPIDMVLNPLGVPSRMNVGQIYECLLGLAAKYLGQAFRVRSFDEMYGSEASRTLTFASLYEARLKTHQKWLFNPKSPGKMKIYDGRTGLPFHQTVTVGVSYILKLVHLVDDKIHCLTSDHDVLTTDGWIAIDKITTLHKVASLEPSTGLVVYQHPLQVFNYPEYKGLLYHIKNSDIDLLVTLNHRMFVKSGISLGARSSTSGREGTFARSTSRASGRKDFSNSDPFIFDSADYKLFEAKDVIGKDFKYLNNGNWSKNDYQFTLPSIISNSISERLVKMDYWLIFFGFWMTEGEALTLLSLREKPGKQEAFGSEDCPITNTEHETVGSFLNLSGERENLSRETLPYRFVPFATDPIPFVDSGFSKSKLKLERKAFSGNKRISKISKRHFTEMYEVQISQSKPCVKNLLKKAIKSLGYNFRVINEKITIHDEQLWSYLRSLSLASSNKTLPSWVWELSQDQARKLVDSLCLAGGTRNENSMNYYTSSTKLADDIMRLALHAGWSGNKNLYISKGQEIDIQGYKIVSDEDLWHISIIQAKNDTTVNYDYHKTQDIQVEEIVTFFQGGVYCLSVPNEVFYVRRNGLPVWTGNSRSTGPYSLVSQQPLRGRSKFGGQRLGEMEVWALEGYGAAFTLLEMLTIKSDDITGRMTLWSNLILHNPIYIGTPESFKVLVCELQALCLDIGLFKFSEESKNKTVPSLTSVSELLKLS